MTSNTCTQPVIAPPDPAIEAAEGGGGLSAVELERLVECVRCADGLLAEAATLAGRLAGSGVCERVEGLPLEQFIALAARMTGTDARMLVTAGRVLADLPVVAGLFTAGTLGWGQVRAIVAATRPLSRPQRRLVDARVAATVEAYPPGVAAFDPDGLVWAVDAAVDELRPRHTERAERRAVQRSFLSRQADFDGGMRCYGEFDPVSAAVINNALDAAMGSRPPAGAGQAGRDPAYHDSDPGAAGEPDGDRDGDGEGDGEDPGGDGDGDGVGGGGWSSSLTGRAAARALVGVCAQALGGIAADGSPRPARPLLTVRVDLSQVTAHPTGTVELGLRGPLPRVGAATLERLAYDADLRAVLFDRARPLAVSDKLTLKDVAEKTRIAVQTRDQGCRFPASPDPTVFTDIDHLHERADGGLHHPDDLAGNSRRFHTIRHKYGWTLTLDPDTAMLTITRSRRHFHSLPNGTHLQQPPETRQPPPQARGHPPQPALPF